LLFCCETHWENLSPGCFANGKTKQELMTCYATGDSVTDEGMMFAQGR